MLSDTVEKHREMAYKVIERFLVIVQENKTPNSIDVDCILLLIKKLIERINTIEFKEKTEELRL